MRQWTLAAIAIAAMGAGMTTEAAETGENPLSTLISGGETRVSLRYRLESVDQDNALEDALASTLRTRITLQSATLADMDLLMEVDNVSTAGARKYDSLMQNRYRGSHSIIADPTGTEVNQARLHVQPSEHHAFSLGRQRINHADQRFLGGVGWRQNEQTHDAIRYEYAQDDFSLDYAWLGGVNRIFDGKGQSVQPTRLDSGSHALLTGGTIGPGRLSAFAYLLDFDNAPALSSRTLGLTYTWSSEYIDLSASRAWQSDHGSALERYDADYSRLALTARAGGLQWQLSREVLGSDGGRKGFSTPLATLHAFQGFTDLFLTTPDEGIEDLHAGVARSWQDLSLALGWHEFRADSADIDYGREWNVTASYRFNPHLSLQLKAASYRAGQHAVDTDKMWLTLNMAL